MTEEKSIIEILERQVELVKEHNDLTKQQEALFKRQADIATELDAIKEVVKKHIKVQKDMHKTLFGDKYSYKGKSYQVKE